jgi:predicted ATP-grasp superfamily ATP-dependent carboligase
VKPAYRTHWAGSELVPGTAPKALRVERARDLEHLVPQLEAHRSDFILQAAVEGGEDRVLSYHAYVRPGGDVVAEFTGRKVRTSPRTYGFSTCVETCDDPEVTKLGRGVLERLSFSGVLKMDLKRDARDGRLYLLEINPRFSLWHHPAALAGASIPQLVYDDCVEPGSAHHAGKVRPGVRWMSARDDFRAMKEHRAAGQLSFTRWLTDLVTADVREDLSLSDPVPTLLAAWQLAEHKLRRWLGLGSARRAEAAR